MERSSGDRLASHTTFLPEKATFNDTVDTAELVKNFLDNQGIDIEAVQQMPVEQRSAFLIKALITEGGPECETVPKVLVEAPSQLGLIIIKPEILPEAHHVVDFLDKAGIHSQLLDPILPSKRDWLDTYGYMLTRYPDAINIYIVQRALGVQPLVFEHFDSHTYISMIQARSDSPIPTDDPDMLFDRLFCGQAEGGPSPTIRRSISRPIMQQLGFETLSGYAAGFDPYHFYRDSGATNLFRAYNGVHIPSDRSEKARNFSTFIKLGND